jgi:protocatechuate 3,4-dioxygenase beta subunit
MRMRTNRVVAATAVTAALAAALLPRLATAQEDPPDPDNTMTVTGRLLDAEGKPVADGRVTLVAELWCRTERPLGIYYHNGLPLTSRVTGPYRTDNQGRFRATAAVGPARPAWAVFAYGAAVGHGQVRVELDKWARSQEITLKLDREHIVRARLIDTQGQPAAGATVQPIMETKMGATLETLVPIEPTPPYAHPLFPPVTADDKGRFLIRGLGTSKVWLEVTHERFATQRVQAQPIPCQDAKDTPFSLVAAKVVEGRVTYGKGGKPAAGARVVAITAGFKVVQCLADDDGRYSLNPFPGDSFSLRVFPAAGQPYLVEKKSLSFSEAARLEADIALERGVLVRGRITESPSGKPVANALVLHRPRKANNPFFKIGSHYYSDWYRDALTTAVSGSDGTFQIAVPPGPGHLFILGPTLDYLHVQTSVGELEYGRPSMLRNYPDGLIALELKPGSDVHEVAATLRRGVTMRTRIETPEGKTPERVTVMSRSYLPIGFEYWQASWNVLVVNNGELVLPGCDPEKGGIAWLFDPAHELGLTLNYSGSEASRPPRTIRLQPCGTATVRFVDAKGKPLKKYEPHLYVGFAPGTIMAATIYSEKDDKELEGDWGFWLNYHFRRDWEPTTDDQGRTTFPGLVPGLTYYVSTFDRLDYRRGVHKVEFRVKPGETLKLPDFIALK